MSTISAAYLKHTANSDYAAIMALVAAGQLTIAPAE